MRRDFKVKILIAVALISVLGVSLGFAAFSSSLVIKSKLSVEPDASTFSVVFSSQSGLDEDGNVVVGDITPTLNGTNTSNIKATDAKINNDGTYPTVDNLSATFSEPGQTVSYTFYSLNVGKYNAFLTSIVFNPLSSGSFIECVPEDGTDDDGSIASACAKISASVTVGSETASATKTGIEGHTLSAGASETVTITFTYASSETYVAEPFEVNLGEIYLTYGTQETDEVPEFSGDTICTAKDSSKSGSTTIGTAYSCAVNDTTSYDFYVLSTSGSTVNLLMSKNLVDDVYFSTYTEKLVESAYTYVTVNSSNPPIILSEVESITSTWSNLPSINDTYTDSLYGTVSLEGKARLPKLSEISAQCTSTSTYGGGGTAYGNCSSWLYGDYWTMTTNPNLIGFEPAAYAFYEYGPGNYWVDDFRVDFNYYGIRPVISVSTSNLG